MSYLIREIDPLLLLFYLVFSLGWMLGGWLLARHLFRARPVERFLAGLSVGFVLSISFVNLLAQVVPLPAAFGLASGIILAFGTAAGWRSGLPFWPGKEDWAFWPQAVWVAGLTQFFWMLLSAHSIFDEFLHMPMISIMAAGDIPPHFYLDPSQHFAYHFSLQVFAAGLVRMAGFFPWSAWDFSRAFATALTLGLIWLWILRLTRSQAAAWWGTLLLGFGGGARWLLLFLPRRVINFIGRHIELTNSGQDSGDTLIEALTGPWVIEGGASLPFPFAYHSGIFSPAFFVLGSTGVMPFLIILLLLFVSRRYSPAGALLGGVIFGALALSAEHVFAPVWMAVALYLLVRLYQAYRARPVLGIVDNSLSAQPRPGLVSRVFRQDPQLKYWLSFWLVGSLLAMVQGGYITEMLRGMISRTPSNNTYGFSVNWVPAILSGHFGELSLLNPIHWPVLLAETGPVFFVLPLAVWAAWRSARKGSALAVILGLTAALSLLLPLFLRFEIGRAMSRLPSMGWWLWLLLVFPTAWRLFTRSASLRRGLWIAGFGISLLAGVVLLTVQISGIPAPQYTYFIEKADAAISSKYWNRLPVEAQVFDSHPIRAVTVFGRAARAYESIYVPRPDWRALVDGGGARDIAAAGYSYIYLSQHWWERMSREQQEAIFAECVRVVHQDDLRLGKFRLLIDITGCAQP
jgi:hypothetical protein